MAKKKDETAQPEKPRTVKKYMLHMLHIKFNDEILASAPANKEVYQKYIQDLFRPLLSLLHQ